MIRRIRQKSMHAKFDKCLISIVFYLDSHMTGIATRASAGLFIRVLRCKDIGPKPHHYFIYYTCEVHVLRKSGRPRLELSLGGIE